jgi:hypothetical protein
VGSVDGDRTVIRRLSPKCPLDDLEIGQNCCRNATHADNISWNGHNA